MSKGRNRNQGYTVFKSNPTVNRKDLIERMYFRVLTELCSNRFEWKGLPEEIDKRFLELTLFYNALAVFYYDTDYDRYMALRAAGTGRLNMYDNPTKFIVIGNTMVNKTLTARECVPIWSNYMRVPDLDIVTIYASKLAETDRTIEINLKNMRTPYLVAVDQDERLSVQNAFKNWEEGAPVIWGTERLAETVNEKMQLWPMSVDKELVTNLLIDRAHIWNECMTLLGIDNANQEKRERLVADEVAANNGQVMASRRVAMQAREQACEQINRMFEGLNVSVEWGLSDNMALENPGNDIEGVDDGDVYNRTAESRTD